jgi:hypothetical protein
MFWHENKKCGPNMVSLVEETEKLMVQVNSFDPRLEQTTSSTHVFADTKECRWKLFEVKLFHLFI